MKRLDCSLFVAIALLSFTATAWAGSDWYRTPNEPNRPTDEVSSNPTPPREKTDSLSSIGISEGVFELSGQTKFNFSKTDIEVTGSPDTEVTSTVIQFDGLYYFKKNLGLGLSVQYDKSETEVDGASLDTSTFLIGPLMTYNIPLKDKFSVFVNGLVGYATLKIGNDDADGWGFQIGGGVKYFPMKSASINATVSYQYIGLEDDYENDYDASGVNFGIGLSIYF